MEVWNKKGESATVKLLDILATKWSDREGIAVAAVNKHPEEPLEIEVHGAAEGAGMTVRSVVGKDKDSYNDIGKDEAVIEEKRLGEFRE